MLIGLTGGIAAGKSLVASEFVKLGAAVIDADAIARELLQPGTAQFTAVKDEFGPAVMKEDGTIDRSALASIIFGNTERRAALNAIMHPAIRRAIFEKVDDYKKENPDRLIIIDAALLIENGLYRLVEKVIVVKTDEATLIKRMAKRDSITIEAAKERLTSQLPMEEKTKYADYIIDNNGSPEDTIDATRKVCNELTEGRNKIS